MTFRGLPLISAENPLLPHARLGELYTLMQRCRALDRRHKQIKLSREGLLAATALQLESGDLLVAEPGDRTQHLLSPAPLQQSDSTELAGEDPGELPAALRLPLCAGAARGFRAAGTTGIVLAFGRAGHAEGGWEETLIWAQRERLPLILAFSDVRGPGRKRGGDPVTFDRLSAVAESCGLPVFPADAEDAVAVYRVMYESALRARAGGGPAVLWGFFHAGRSSPGSRSLAPLPRLTAYCKARGIKLPH